MDDLYGKHRQRFAKRFPGFECGGGWATLIDSTLSEMAMKCPDVRIVQVKEKMGGLRIYLEDKRNEIAKGLLHDAEEISFTVCEICGEAGVRIASDGWVRVRCYGHQGI